MLTRIRHSLERAAFRIATREILATPTLACEPTADCTVHTMLSAADLNMYLVAIKSFLAHYKSVQVLIHSDGSLRRRHANLLHKHIRGCRIIDKPQADTRAARELGAGSYLFHCREMDINYRRLIDTELHNTTPKRIILDADVIVLHRPVGVIDWIKSGNGGMLLGQAPHPRPPASNDLSRAHVQTQFKARLNEIAAYSKLDAAFADGATAGFYGCRNELRLDLIERVVRACHALGLSLEHWGSDQCVVIYLLAVAGASRLDENRYFNFWPEQRSKIADAHVIHFLGTNRHYQGIYRRCAASMIKSLCDSLPNG